MSVLLGLLMGRGKHTSVLLGLWSEVNDLNLLVTKAPNKMANVCIITYNKHSITCLNLNPLGLKNLVSLL